MQTNFLHLDGALAAQADLIRTAAGARHLHATSDGARVRLWAKQHALDTLQKKITELFMGQGPFLTFMGSGDFHHITALLLAEVARKDPAPITLIHFDNHPDWVNFTGGLHCGSWVNAARAIPNVHRALTLGLCSDDIHNTSGQANTDLTASGFLEIFPFAEMINSNISPSPCGRGTAVPDHWSGTKPGGGGELNSNFTPSPQTANLAALAKQFGPLPQGEREAFINFFLTRIPTENVYITLDKDVLAPADAITNWDQGQMRLDDVIHIINAIGAKHKIIGADVIGDYSPVRFSGPPLTKILKYGEVFLDHPHARPDAAHAAKTNTAANIRLLAAFSVLMQ